MKLELDAPAAADIAVVGGLINRSESFDGIPRVLELDELREDLEAPHVDLQRDSRVAIVDGNIVGWVLVDHTPSGVVEERAFISGTVDPAHRGRGVGRALMAWAAETAASRLLATGNDLAKYIRVYGYGQMADLQQLLAHMGFTQVRWFDELLLPLDNAEAAHRPPRQPEGVTIVPWPVDRSEELRIVKNEAFTDHWGSTPAGLAEWDSRVNGYGSRLDLSFAAVDDETGHLVGLSINKNYPADEGLLNRRDGWIDTLATLRAWRGRGIASSLIEHSLQAFRDAGFTHATLAVDSDSPTGASRLYRSLGFEPQQRDIVSEIRVL